MRCLKVKKRLENWTKNYIFWFIVAVIIGIVIKCYEVLVGYPIPYNGNYRLLYSSIVSILASIFALIFVILTISIQMSRKYTSFNILINRDTRILMATYLITIVSSLWSLQFDYYFPIAFLTITTFCIFSLYPLLHNMNFLILFDVGINNLSEEVNEAIDLKRDISAKNKILALGTIGEKAIEERMFDKLVSVLDIFEDNIEDTKYEQLTHTFEEIGTQYLNFANHISKETENKLAERLLKDIKNYMTSRIQGRNIEVLIEQIKMVKKLSMKFIENDFNEKHIIILERALFNNLEMRYKEDFSEYSILYLKDMATESYHKSLINSYIYATTYLWLIGITAFCEMNKLKENINKLYAEKELNEAEKIEDELKTVEKIRTSIVKQLFEIEKLVGSDEFENTFEKCKTVDIFPIQQKSKEFDDFKKEYLKLRTRH